MERREGGEGGNGEGKEALSILYWDERAFRSKTPSLLLVFRGGLSKSFDLYVRRGKFSSRGDNVNERAEIGRLSECSRGVPSISAEYAYKFRH